MVAGPQLFHSWYTWVKPVIRAAAGTGQGVAVGGGAGVEVGGVSTGDSVEFESPVRGWDVGLGGNSVVITGGGKRPSDSKSAAAAGATVVGRMGADSGGNASACSGSGSRMA